MKETLTNKIRIGFAFSVATLVVLTIISFYNLNLLTSRAEWVNHTNEVLLKLNEVVSGLKDAETGQRGYLLTRNPEFLEPYIGSYHRVFQSYNDAKRLTIDNPKQQDRLDTLRILINDRFNQISTTIELEKRGQSDSAQNIVKQGRGREIMDNIRKLINKMVQDEIVLRRERNEAVKTTSFLMPIFILIFSVAALLIAITFYFLINRDNRKRMEAERKLQATKNELEQSYEELTVREEELRALNMQLEDRVKERTHEVLQGIQQLRQSEMRYRLLIEGVADYAIFMLDTNGNIISWNYGAERLKGYKEEEIIGKHFSAFYPKDLVEAKHPDKELKAAREKGKYEEEGWRVRKDGTVFWANVLINALHDEHGQLMGFSKITRDLTERKRAEDNLRKVNYDLDSFIYIASHDLKAPISNLEGLLNSVHQEAKPECKEEEVELFDLMQASIQKLKATIQELSDVHQLQRSWAEDIEVVRIEELLGEVKNLHRDIIESSGAKFFTDLAIRSFKISRKNIFLILDNLIKNAVQYKSPQRAPEILVSTEEKLDWIVLSVKDNGLGIDMSRPDKIFAMFQRLHDHVEGSGVGLYMVKKIIENQGGKIEVESEMGVGSTFKAYFKKSVMVN